MVVTDLVTRFGVLPGGVWPEPPHTAVVLPISIPGQDRAAGLLVAGSSPRRPLDDQYRAFFDLLASQLGTVVASARAYEQEKQRAEQLAELDRAKTTFFSNVSHEFRTPLTLILGPVEDVLADEDERLTPHQRERLAIAHRNGLRLQKLVNTLLDFSRIEAGRVRACYEATDLASLTTELASNFRSACEKAGLGLVVDCPPLAEPVFVDRDMWEKVVLNLLSNAFKFTMDGHIEVRLRMADRRVELAVRDTGAGIPAGELPRLFERFYRVEGTRGRTQEGSGIGLALVRELVRLHGGEVRAESEHGKGSVFTVSLPLGKEHLPADRVGAARSLASTALGAAPYVAEALRWLPDVPVGVADSSHGVNLRDGGDGRTRSHPGAVGECARILLADDNAAVQVDRSLERSQGGLGIGLTLVKRLVELHGGSVEARSDGPGRGSEFIVCLPLAEAQQSPGADARTGDGRAAARRRILVADDNEDAADSLATLLELLGHDVATAHDGLQAVELEGSFRPDVALLDLGMPGLNGYEAARRIRERRGTSGGALVALTGWGRDDDRRSQEAGFDHHLVKPVDPAVLGKLLAESGAKTGCGRRESGPPAKLADQAR